MIFWLYGFFTLNFFNLLNTHFNSNTLRKVAIMVILEPMVTYGHDIIDWKRTKTLHFIV